MEMKQYSVRVDHKLAEILERNAQQQGIKVTRYIRSLLEKGLVIDTQIQQGVLTEKKDNSKSYFDIRIAEVVAQTLVLSRKLIRTHLKSEEASSNEISDAERRAKEFISDLIGSKETL